MISVRNVGKNFGPLAVLRDISLDVADGEVLAVLGPSGSGKSTLIRCVNGLEAIDTGDITVDGVSVRERRNLPAIRRNCAMVFQQFNLYPHLTVLDNVTLAPRIVLRRDRPNAEATATGLLAQVGLAGRERSYPHQLSGGQMQRVGICRALAMQPRHLLLDEVTSSLDPEMTAEVLMVIEQLARAGTTMVLVTHEMAFARRIADRIAFMEGGRLLHLAGTEDFFTHADPRIRRFLDRLDARDRHPQET